MSTSVAQYSFSEELANAITHGIGALVSVAALTMLLMNAINENNTVKIVSFAIYGSSLVLMFLMSTLYHAIFNESVKKFFKLCDHCAIYILIAGTYTPLMLVTLNGFTGYLMCALVWLLAAVGIFFKLYFKYQYNIVGVLSYLLMGLLSLLVIKGLYLSLSSAGLILLCLGGGFYAVGVFFYIYKKIPFNHAIWHLFVLAGACSHFFMMLFYV